jgi:hypothetical protein
VKLTNKQTIDFQAIHKKVFGSLITKQQAMSDGLSVIRLIALIQPMLEELLDGES